MCVDGNKGANANYEPNSLGLATEDKSKKLSEFEVKGKVGKYPYTHPNTDYEQPRTLFRKVMN